MLSESSLHNYSGVLLVDKPSGVTSHDVVAWARRATGVSRIGHAGTLDPLASGLLILLVSRAFTKRQGEFLKQDKEYECTALLGIETDTHDTDGQLVNQTLPENFPQVSRLDLQRVIEQFQGKQEQVVPAFSAVKRNGKKLYELARVGKIQPSSLPVRTVIIHELELLATRNFQQEAGNWSPPEITLRVRCSSGTYVRSLVRDIGRALGVGATVSALRRTASGEFSIQEARLCPLFEYKRRP